MKTIYVIAEGRTECNFVKTALSAYFLKNNILLIPVTIPTGKNPSGGVAKGGWRRSGGYNHALREIQRIIKTNNYATHTTLFDFYAFPNDVPCYEDVASLSDPLEKATLYEKQLHEDVVHSLNEDSNFKSESFIPFIQPHEFEAYLFVDPRISAWELSNGNASEAKRIENAIAAVSNQFDSPEHINDDIKTAPSKRIGSIVPGFTKYKAGKAGFSSRIAKAIGIEKIREECCHFDRWLSILEENKTI